MHIFFVLPGNLATHAIATTVGLTPKDKQVGIIKNQVQRNFRRFWTCWIDLIYRFLLLDTGLLHYHCIIIRSTAQTSRFSSLTSSYCPERLQVSYYPERLQCLWDISAQQVSRSISQSFGCLQGKNRSKLNFYTKMFFHPTLLLLYKIHLFHFLTPLYYYSCSMQLPDITISTILYDWTIIAGWACVY